MPVIPLIIFIFVFGSLILELVVSNQLSTDEKQSQMIYQQKYCAGYINNFRYKGPFIRFSLYKNFLVVSTLKKRVIQLRNIIDVEVEKKYARQLTIKAHVNNKTQVFIIFMPQADEVLKQILKLKKEA